MEVPDINKLVDDRLKTIWSEVKNHYNLTLKFHDKDHYSCGYNGKEVTMHVTKDGCNPNFFAHEILHFYIRLNGLDIGQLLISSFRSDQLLLKILSEPLIHQITNSLEHFKMRPIYLERGFDEGQFVVNYNQPVADFLNILNITSELSNNSVSSQFAASDYIGAFFSMKANSNPQIDYSDLLDLLKTADEGLYNIIGEFWNDWVNFDITDSKNNLHPLITKFYSSLGDWIKMKYTI